MLETAVRPFTAAPNLATRIIIARNTRVQVTQAELIFGAAGTLPTPTVHAAGFGFKVENCNNTNTEKSRKQTPVKIQQKDNPDNWVMVQRIEQIVFSKKPDDVQNDFKQAFSSFAKSVADAINSPWAGVLTATDCNEKYNLKNN